MTANRSNSSRYALFETDEGPCGVVWSAAGIVALLLPERTPEELRARALRAAGPAAEEAGARLPAPIASLVSRVRGQFRTGDSRYDDVELDTTATGEFDRAVYAAAREIPAGQTRTYGELARAVGKEGAARAVGQSMGRNPWPLIVPCHRVVAAGGKMCGFSAVGGVDLKRRLLALEGVKLTPSKSTTG